MYQSFKSRMDSHNEDRQRDIEDLRTRMMKENEFLRGLANKSMGVYFDAYRSKVNIYIYLTINLFILLYIYPSSIYPYIKLFIYISGYLYIYQTIYLSIKLSIYLSCYLFIYQAFKLFI